MRLSTAAKQARKNAGKTLRELAEACGLSIGYISDIEHGRKRASFEVLRKIESALGVNGNVLIKAAEQEVSTKDKIKQLFKTRPQASLALLRLAEEMTDDQLNQLLEEHCRKEEPDIAPI